MPAGHKKEEFCAIVCLRGNTVADIGGTLAVDGLKLRVIDVAPFRDSVGKIDHFEVAAKEWN